MTDYIKEMMKTAGVEKIWIRNFIVDDDGFIKYNFQYPDFTPEKQLEIIKLIFTLYLPIYSRASKKIVAFMNVMPLWYENAKDSFEQALARLTTELMKLGKLDRQKVKEILEK